MIKKTNDQKLSDVLKSFAAQDKLKEKLLSTKIMEIWIALYPGLIAEHTVEVRVKQSQVIIKVNSASLRQELLMNKKTILDQLNQKLGDNLIQVLEFR